MNEQLSTTTEICLSPTICQQFETSWNATVTDYYFINFLAINRHQYLGHLSWMVFGTVMMQRRRLELENNAIYRSPRSFKVGVEVGTVVAGADKN